MPETLGKSDLVDLDLYLFSQTEKAILVGKTGGRMEAVWLPKSLVEIKRQPDTRRAMITMPEWLAIKRGLA